MYAELVTARYKIKGFIKVRDVESTVVISHTIKSCCSADMGEGHTITRETSHDHFVYD